MKIFTPALLCTLLSFSAQAREGFYKEGQIATEFSVANARKAALFVEEFKDGKWKHMGNAFFIHQDGYLITNYHIASHCLRDQRAYFKGRFGSMEKVYNEGFLAGKDENLVCKSIRVSDDPASEKRFTVSIVALPPIGEGNEPSWDFAVLKVNDSAKPAGWHFLSSGADIIDDKSEVFLVGYPAFTKRKNFSVPMQRGEYDEVSTGDYRIGVGKVLEFHDGFFHGAQRERFLYTDTDGGQGSSGSPLLDAQGKLIGLILGSGDRANSNNNTSGCNLHYEYCGGVSLYLKASYIHEVLTKQFPSLSEVLFAK